MEKGHSSIWWAVLLLQCLMLIPLGVLGQGRTKPLTNGDVIAMVKGGLAESTIIGVIRNQGGNFDVSASALIKLHQQGVSPKIMSAMIDIAKKGAVPAQAGTVTEPPEIASANPHASEITSPRSVRLSSYDMDLLAIRDNPQLINDIALKLTEDQIQVEQRVWEQIHRREHPRNFEGVVSNGPPFPGLNPKRPTFIFEWQKLITARPELARGPLLNVFLYPNADWSFVKREPGWDDRYKAIVEPFIFSKEAIEGRNPEFAAHELVPLIKQFLKLAASKAPTNYWFDVRLPGWDYDFNAKAIRFDNPRTSGFASNVNLLRPVSDAVFVAPPKGSQADGRLLPADARSHLNYDFFTEDDRNVTPTLPSEKQPGVEMQSPAQGWRDDFPMLGPSFPSFQALALGRQLAISGIPIDPKSAERLMNGQSLHGPHSAKTGSRVAFTARVYIHTNRVEIETMPGGQKWSDAFMFASVQKVEILGLHDELIADFGPDRFRAAKDVLATDAAARAKAIAEAKEKEKQEAARRLQRQQAIEAGEERRKEEIRREGEAAAQKQQQKVNGFLKQMQANVRKEQECSARAYKAAHAVELAHGVSQESNKVYNDTLNACMKEKPSESK